MPRSIQLDIERNATSTSEGEAGVLVVKRHHLLVRCSHWLNVALLLGPHREKNVKAIPRITYASEEPKDYWAKRGYSYCDGI